MAHRTRQRQEVSGKEKQETRPGRDGNLTGKPERDEWQGLAKERARRGTGSDRRRKRHRNRHSESGNDIGAVSDDAGPPPLGM